MTVEARKYKLISQITHIEDDATLKELEETVERLLHEQQAVHAAMPAEHNTMAAYRGILSSETAESLIEYVAQSRDEWERDI